MSAPHRRLSLKVLFYFSVLVSGKCSGFRNQVSWLSPGLIWSYLVWSGVSLWDTEGLETTAWVWGGESVHLCVLPWKWRDELHLSLIQSVCKQLFVPRKQSVERRMERENNKTEAESAVLHALWFRPADDQMRVWEKWLCSDVKSLTVLRTCNKRAFCSFSLICQSNASPWKHRLWQWVSMLARLVRLKVKKLFVPQAQAQSVVMFRSTTWNVSKHTAPFLSFHVSQSVVSVQRLQCKSCGSLFIALTLA